MQIKICLVYFQGLYVFYVDPMDPSSDLFTLFIYFFGGEGIVQGLSEEAILSLAILMFILKLNNVKHGYFVFFPFFYF